MASGVRDRGRAEQKTGGIVIGGVIAPIFFNTAEDSGALPIIADVSGLEMGDLIDIYPYRGEIVRVGRSGKSGVNLSDESDDKFKQSKIYNDTASGSHAQASELVANYPLAKHPAR